MANQIIYLIVSITLNRFLKGMTLKDHLLEANERFSAVMSRLPRGAELYALCVL